MMKILQKLEELVLSWKEKKLQYYSNRHEDNNLMDIGERKEIQTKLI